MYYNVGCVLWTNWLTQILHDFLVFQRLLKIPTERMTIKVRSPCNLRSNEAMHKMSLCGLRPVDYRYCPVGCHKVTGCIKALKWIEWKWTVVTILKAFIQTIRTHYKLHQGRKMSLQYERWLQFLWVVFTRRLHTLCYERVHSRPWSCRKRLPLMLCSQDLSKEQFQIKSGPEWITDTLINWI